MQNDVLERLCWDGPFLLYARSMQTGLARASLIHVYFEKKDGPVERSTSPVMYAAYVFFEKIRLRNGVEKTEFRLEMEDLWESMVASIWRLITTPSTLCMQIGTAVFMSTSMERSDPRNTERNKGPAASKLGQSSLRTFVTTTEPSVANHRCG
jgi:hypothetical protein